MGLVTSLIIYHTSANGHGFRKHTREKPYHCDICHKLSLLWSKEETVLYACMYFRFILGEPRIYQLSLLLAICDLMHSEDKPYTCPYHCVLNLMHSSLCICIGQGAWKASDFNMWWYRQVYKILTLSSPNFHTLSQLSHCKIVHNFMHISHYKQKL